MHSRRLAAGYVGGPSNVTTTTAVAAGPVCRPPPHAHGTHSRGAHPHRTPTSNTCAPRCSRVVAHHRSSGRLTLLHRPQKRGYRWFHLGRLSPVDIADKPVPDARAWAQG